MINLLGNIIISIGIVFICFGVFGIFRFNDFYSRILIASKVDTVGFITIMTGVILKQGFSFFSLKVLLILIVMIITNPLATHSIARSAYFSGYRVKKGE
ncbi:monovalent cation/H(+) antiporter subunit G [Petroclostridium sp. X23]|uniref:monovalent cation/H(+) antiporter subunit G n=1 Tax=Petroclostridium sp. X23 TaxID=3045146 RepID=UPI0024AE6862|nr:monovalent cation/H(+) antiporter subunit G [Petroclostridium sp. X23]WHH57696.1 monovalent cation/H(+) antiporter subunit G [Petroclostridium sp. X23]